jgi:GT2 family glycosyltransferase
MIACNLFYPRETPAQPWHVQCAGGTFRDGRIAHLHGKVLKDLEATEGGVSEAILGVPRPVDWVTFAGVLIRRHVIRACGPFDRRYRWAYVMDVDYSFEARLRGFRLFQVPVSLQHEENRTTRPIREADAQLQDYIARNFDLFYEKWRPFTGALAPS